MTGERVAKETKHLDCLNYYASRIDWKILTIMPRTFHCLFNVSFVLFHAAQCHIKTSRQTHDETDDKIHVTRKLFSFIAILKLLCVSISGFWFISSLFSLLRICHKFLIILCTRSNENENSSLTSRWESARIRNKTRHRHFRPCFFRRSRLVLCFVSERRVSRLAKLTILMLKVSRHRKAEHHDRKSKKPSGSQKVSESKPVLTFLPFHDEINFYVLRTEEQIVFI